MSEYGKIEITLFIKTAIRKKNMMLKKMKADEKNVILALASFAIPLNQPLSELEVNNHLLSWLNNDGEMLKIDYIELRRTLIDSQFWTRNKIGSEYIRHVLGQQHPAFEIMNILNELDIHKFIKQVKMDYETEVLERKIKFHDAKAI